MIIILAAAALAFLAARKLFAVKQVNVEGNEIYSDEQIEDWVLNDDYSRNTLYVFLKSRFLKQDDIPFVDTMEVTLESPSELTITVTEKGILGYVYAANQGKYAYFDQDGFVVELSEDLIQDVVHITGLDVEDAVLYEKLDLDSDTLKSLITLTQILQKYERRPDVIYVMGTAMLLSYGDIQVDLGAAADLTAKIIRMNEILPGLEGEKGTLHLDTWSENNGDIYFKPNEMTKIPDY